MNTLRTNATVQPPAAHGAFRANGSWDSDLHRGGPRTQFVMGCLIARRTMDLSPADFCYRILSAGFDSLLTPTATETWPELKEPNQWRLARTSNSFEEWLKREGRGGEDGHWHASHWILGPDRRPAEHQIQALEPPPQGLLE